MNDGIVNQQHKIKITNIKPIWIVFQAISCVCLCKTSEKILGKIGFFWKL
jgi:hypothetical protein